MPTVDKPALCGIVITMAEGKDIIEEVVELAGYSDIAVAPVKRKKIDAVGLAYYGGTFTRYTLLKEINDLTASFKDFYYEAKVKDPNARLAGILQDFNKEVCVPLNRIFHPHTQNVRRWRSKWDLDLMQQTKDKDLVVLERKNVHQVIKTRNEDRELVLGATGEEELEQGIRTLGGELVNDAMQMLRDDQELDEIYETDELIRRRNYIVNVFAHVTKLVHGKAALMLKASEEKRNTAGFLMSLLSRATSGNMTDAEMNLLKSAYAPENNNEQPKE